jgi:DNA-binding beta-propeller fold protein YncE
MLPYHRKLLSAVGSIVRWSIDGWSYASKSKSVSGSSTNCVDLAISGDGTKLYVLNDYSGEGIEINQYNLGTPYDISTASSSPDATFDISGQFNDPLGLWLKPDGTKIYVCGSNTSNQGTVCEYTLSTANLISSASLTNTYSVHSPAGQYAQGLCLNSSGTKMYVCVQSGFAIYQYTLSTGFDVSSASYDSVSFSDGLVFSQPKGIFLSSDDQTLFIAATPLYIFQYTLSTPSDLSTASYDTVSVPIDSEDNSPQGVTLSQNAKHMYVAGRTNSTIFQYGA